MEKTLAAFNLYTRLSRIVLGFKRRLKLLTVAMALSANFGFSIAKAETQKLPEKSENKSETMERSRIELIELLNNFKKFTSALDEEKCSKIQTDIKEESESCEKNRYFHYYLMDLHHEIRAMIHDLEFIPLGSDSDEEQWSIKLHSANSENYFFGEVQKFWDQVHGGQSTCGVFDDLCFRLSSQEINYINSRGEELMVFMGEYLRLSNLIKPINVEAKAEKLKKDLFGPRKKLAEFISRVNQIHESLSSKGTSQKSHITANERYQSRATIQKKGKELAKLKVVAKDWLASGKLIEIAKTNTFSFRPDIEMNLPMQSCNRKTSELCQSENLIYLTLHAISSGLFNIKRIDDLALMNDLEFYKFQRTYHRVTDCLGAIDFQNSKTNILINSLQVLLDYQSQPEQCYVNGESIEQMNSRLAVHDFINWLLRFDNLTSMKAGANLSVKSVTRHPPEHIYSAIIGSFNLINDLASLAKNQSNRTWLESVGERLRLTFQAVSENGTWNKQSLPKIQTSISCLFVLKMRLDQQLERGKSEANYQNYSSAIEIKDRISDNLKLLISDYSMEPNPEECRL